MQLRMDKTLRFWTDVAYHAIKADHPNLTKRQLLAQILRQYEKRGDATRFLDGNGRVAWRANPQFLEQLADAERDVEDELDDFA